MTKYIARLELQNVAVVDSHVGSADAGACYLDDSTFGVTRCRLVNVLHLYVALALPSECCGCRAQVSQ